MPLILPAFHKIFASIRTIQLQSIVCTFIDYDCPHINKIIFEVFLFLSKTYNAAVQIESDVIFWDSLKEYENRIVTVRKHDGTSYVRTSTKLALKSLVSSFNPSIISV